MQRDEPLDGFDDGIVDDGGGAVLLAAVYHTMPHGAQRQVVRPQLVDGLVEGGGVVGRTLWLADALDSAIAARGRVERVEEGELQR